MELNLRVSHQILVAGPDFKTCRKKVLLFFEKNMLVRYDIVRIMEEESSSAMDPSFWKRVAQGETANRKVLAELVSEIKDEGVRNMDDILGIEQGYRSKTFHTIAHLLDGFFGIDSCLYNLEDDSHWVSDNLRQQIEKHPTDYWLLQVKAESKGKTADRLHILRSFTPEN